MLLRPRHLFGSWVVYWIVLIVAAAWRPLLTYWTVTRTPNGHGSASWSYSGGLLGLVLWIFGVPLLLYAAWALLRRRQGQDAV
jgi:hypothetical protein